MKYFTMLAIIASFAFAACGGNDDTTKDNANCSKIIEGLCNGPDAKDGSEYAAEPEPTQDESASDIGPGSPSVYKQIARMTNCAKLQEKFDIAADNHDREVQQGDLEMMKITTSYMDAADNRMSEVGCY